MHHPATPEGFSGIPASWLIPRPRREVAIRGGQLAIGGTVALTLNHLMPGTAAGQDRSFDPIAFKPVRPEEQALVNAIPDVTTEQELSQIASLKKKHMYGTRVEFSSPSALDGRPNLMFTLDGRLRFIRRVVLGNRGAARLSSDDYTSAFGEPAAVVPAPMSEPGLFSPIDFETQVWPSQGFAVVANRNATAGRYVAEVYKFTPMPLREFHTRWGHGYYGPGLPDRPGAIFLIDGLKSKLKGEVTPAKTTFKNFRQDVLRYYLEVFEHSPNGGTTEPRPDGLPNWIPNEYEPDDTSMHPVESADVIFRELEQLKAHRPFDFLVYSKGGPDLMEYLKRYVLPTNAPHRIGYVRKAAFVHSPINGVDFASWAPGVPERAIIDTLNNPAIQHLAELARNRDFNTATNSAMLEFLRKWQISTLHVGNNDDCLAPFQSFITLDSNHARGYSLGRGDKGVTSCELQEVAPALYRRENSRLGHDQGLSDFGVIKTVEGFLKTDQLRPFLGE